VSRTEKSISLLSGTDAPVCQSRMNLAGDHEVVAAEDVAFATVAQANVDGLDSIVIVDAQDADGISLVQELDDTFVAAQVSGRGLAVVDANRTGDGNHSLTVTLQVDEIDDGGDAQGKGEKNKCGNRD